MHRIPHPTILILLVTFLCSASCNFYKVANSNTSNVVLAADTSHPSTSTFIPGEKISLNFSVRGLTPANSGLKLQMTIKNEHNEQLSYKEISAIGDRHGNWKTTVAAPNTTLGFYRVEGQLSNGVTLASLGSREPGFLTYAIVPDPATRVDVGEMSHFGMQGGFNTNVNVIPYLGVRWVLGSPDYGWQAMEHDYTGQFDRNKKAALAQFQQYPAKEEATESVTYMAKPWTVYTLPTLYHSTPEWATIPVTQGKTIGALLVPDGEHAWSHYVTAASRAYAAHYPNRQQHIYQITWEPTYPNYRGTEEQLIRIYQLAYQALHKADPKAVVIGPCGFPDAGDNTRWLEHLLDLGLGKYLDGFSIHPYEAYPPEPAGMITDLRTQKSLVNSSAGKELPQFATEHGYAVSDKLTELEQARGDIRQSLIVLGEGYRFDFAFYVADWPENNYGFYYNLNPDVAFGTDKVSPRPVVPAFAAETFLLDGYHSLGAIENLGGQSWGYVFERAGDVILALWDYGDRPHQVSLPTGVKAVTLYDWMGNPRRLTTVNGNVSTILGPEPVYIRGVLPQIWRGKRSRYGSPI